MSLIRDESFIRESHPCLPLHIDLLEALGRPLSYLRSQLVCRIQRYVLANEPEKIETVTIALYTVAHPPRVYPLVSALKRERSYKHTSCVPAAYGVFSLAPRHTVARRCRVDESC